MMGGVEYMLLRRIFTIARQSMKPLKLALSVLIGLERISARYHAAAVATPSSRMRTVVMPSPAAEVTMPTG